MRTAWPAFARALRKIAKDAAKDHLGGARNADLGYPAGGVKAKFIWVKTGTVSCDSPISGHAQRDETLTADVCVKVDSTSFDAGLSLVEDVLAAIDDAIAADMTLGGTVDLANVTSIAFEEAIPDERTRTVAATVTVTADATVSDD